MTEAELKRLAVDIVEGKVFGSWMIPEQHQDKLANIFLPISVGGQAMIPDDVWSLYEYRDKSLAVTCEGMPVFLSCKYLQREDGERLGDMIRTYSDLVSGFLKS